MRWWCGRGAGRTRHCRRYWNSSGRRRRSSMRRSRVRRAARCVITSLVIVMIATMGLIPVDQVVSVHGIAISKAATILVQPLETAIVRSIEVREGQQVKAGEVLAKLDPTFAAADLSALKAQ